VRTSHRVQQPGMQIQVCHGSCATKLVLLRLQSIQSIQGHVKVPHSLFAWVPPSMGSCRSPFMLVPSSMGAFRSLFARILPSMGSSRSLFVRVPPTRGQALGALLARYLYRFHAPLQKALAQPGLPSRQLFHRCRNR